MAFRTITLFLSVILLTLCLIACSAKEPATAVNEQTSPYAYTNDTILESTKETETVSVSDTDIVDTSAVQQKTIAVIFPDSLAGLKERASMINEPEGLHELFDYSDMDGAYSLKEAIVTYMGRMPYGDDPLYSYIVYAYCYIDDNGAEKVPDGYVFPYDKMAQTLSDLGLVVITGYEKLGVYDPEKNPTPQSKRYLVAAPEGLVGEIFQHGGDPIAHWMF